MTEVEWNACKDPALMLAFLPRKMSKRKLRLFAVVCCRRIWTFLNEEGYQRTLLAVEHWADAAMEPPDWQALREPAIVARELLKIHWHIDMGYHAVLSTGHLDARLAAIETSEDSAAKLALIVEVGDKDSSLVVERQAQSRLLRDVFRPFRACTANPLWLTTPVRRLADSPGVRSR